MTTFTPNQILVAARAWLDSTRREWCKRNPNKNCFMPTWEQLTPPERATILNSIGAALRASDPANVQQVMDRDAQNSVS